MTSPTEHIGFEMLNDYVDGRLDSGSSRAVEEHTKGCERCSGELAELRMLLDGVALLPRSVLPDDDIWADLKASIEDRKEVVLPTGLKVRGQPVPDTAGQARGPLSMWRTHAVTAAAAVVLVVASSGVTALVLRNQGNAPYRNQGQGSGAQYGVSSAPVLPASFRIAEGKYVSTIEELRAAFETQRSQLTPETVRTVDRSLAVIDSAIAEAREALLSDPGNRTLVDLLSASYQRKLDLLRRTSELTPRT